MGKIFTLALSLFISLSAAGQSKLNPAGRHALTRYRQEAVKSRATEAPVVAMLVRTAGESDADSLAAAGYDVVSRLGRFVIVRAAVTEAGRLAEMDRVKSVSFGNKRRMLMKAARATSGVDQSHDGIAVGGVTRQFTGEGVILGLMDGGLYPNHINFENRVERLWHFSGDDGSFKEYDATSVADFSTDDKTETHATHVAGIMGGGYRGTATFKNGTSTVTGLMPHYGVAPDATLAFSCGELYDANILQGVKNIIEYAESQGKPVAVNLSLGSNSGPHDGSDDFSQALDALGQRALISVSAGNEGADNMSIEKTFTSSDRTLKTILFYNNSYVSSNVGTLDIWASDGRQLTVSIGTVNSSGTISNSTSVSLSTGDEEQQIKTGVKNGGEVWVYSEIDANNGRHHVYFYFDNALPSSGRFAITVSGQEGQSVNLYFEGYSTFSNRYNPSLSPLSGFTAGTPDNSINGMGCGRNVLTVGAYSTTDSWQTLSAGAGSTSGETVGAHATFSSYGHDFSGRQLPEISAPGSALMSSFSPAYVDGGYGDDYGESASEMVASAKSSRGTDYWGPMEGTSMSCPFVTGTLGLWLQADPTLTIDDVREILEKTSTADSYTKAAPERFGYGKINAARGLEYILAKASLGTVTDDGHNVVVIATPYGYDVTAAGAGMLSGALYDLQGRCVGAARSDSNRLSISAAGLSAGVYLLKVTGGNLNYSTKVVRQHQ